MNVFGSSREPEKRSDWLMKITLLRRAMLRDLTLVPDPKSLFRFFEFLEPFFRSLQTTLSEIL